MRINVWSSNLRVNNRMKLVAERRIGYALRAFSNKVRDVDVFLADLQGSRDGKARHCRVTVTLIPTGHAIVNDYEKRFAIAISKAAERTKHAIAKKVEKRRDHREAKLAKMYQSLSTP